MPLEYEKIFIYDEYVKTMKNAAQEAKLGAFAFPGFYIRIVLNGLDVGRLSQHPSQKPLVHLYRNNYL